MATNGGTRSVTVDQISVSVAVLGLLVALFPIVYLGLPREIHELTFPVLFMQFTGVIVGLAVIWAGYYSKKSGDILPALGSGLFIIGLVLVGVIGALVETLGGPLVPIWVWGVSALAVGGIAVVLAKMIAPRISTQ